MKKILIVWFRKETEECANKSGNQPFEFVKLQVFQNPHENLKISEGMDGIIFLEDMDIWEINKVQKIAGAKLPAIRVLSESVHYDSNNNQMKTETSFELACNYFKNFFN